MSVPTTPVDAGHFFPLIHSLLWLGPASEDIVCRYIKGQCVNPLPKQTEEGLTDNAKEKPAENPNLSHMDGFEQVPTTYGQLSNMYHEGSTNDY